MPGDMRCDLELNATIHTYICTFTKNVGKKYLNLTENIITHHNIGPQMCRKFKKYI